MNSKRTDYTKVPGYTIKITPTWLLGFTEGDGSFVIDKSVNYTLIYRLSQANRDQELMEEIINFLKDLSGDYKNIAKKTTISKSREGNQLDMIIVSITNQDFINKVFIPFFDSVTFYSKKRLDYLDWKTVSQ
uniref:LAGLIDADG endonuclease n=1 Tax=Ophiocordyceps sinensis TaxID=72228 RepID=A0A1W5T0D6_9HYPO|nr:LAGLIDADG endonuclease [Ophiocordyceps sinensis]ARF03370.1 LAGLIDADG endonuclease [Ophiocordyceps sinensis]QDH07195.1 LAGLIDADG endonuclease [Ophiocordyceps sinensis]